MQLKNTILIDWRIYDSRKYNEYKVEIERIFKHLVVRSVKEKVELISKLEKSLPIIVIGNPENIYYRTICGVANQLLYLTKDDPGFLYYKTKKVYGKKLQNTLNQYSFYFSTGDKHE